MSQLALPLQTEPVICRAVSTNDRASVPYAPITESVTQMPVTVRPGDPPPFTSAVADYSKLVRKSDPTTSVDAAKRATAFVASHEAKIYAVLSALHGRTIYGIADETGLDRVAIARRMKSMEERKLVTRRILSYSNGRPVYESRDGCGLWWKCHE